MDITESRYETVIVLALAGRLDQDSSAEFQTKLLEIIEHGGAALVLDFADIEYISSVGLRALMIGAKKCRSTGGKLAVAALQPVVKEVFQRPRQESPGKSERMMLQREESGVNLPHRMA